MRIRSIVGGFAGMRIVMAGLLTLGLSIVATTGAVLDSSQPAAAQSCPTLEPEGPVPFYVPVPGPSAGVDWSGCDLSGATIVAGTLTDANLSGADLSGAWLSGTDLSGADLSDANMTSAWVGGRCAGGVYSYDGADLEGADLTDADLTSAHLGGEFQYYGSLNCIVYGAELNDVTITGADLSGANLIGLVASGDITGQPASLPVQWLLDNGILYGPGATCSKVTGKATIKFKDCAWTIMNPITSIPSASIPESGLGAGGTLKWQIAHPQTGGPRQTSVVSLASLSSPGQGVCPSGFTEQDFSGILSSGFDAGDAVTAQLCQKTKTGSFELAPGTTAGL
jgi:uncharacterized protein YjbI with pentapeptide repeats